MTPNGLELALAAVLPLLVGFVKQAKYAATTNAAIALGVYVAAGVVAVIAQGQPFDLATIVPSIGVFTVGGTAAYTLFWKNIEGAPSATPAAGK